MRTLVRIEKEVPLTIFGDPEVKKRTEELFKSMEEEIKVRIDEIIGLLEVQPTEKLSYDKIIIFFKEHFYELILNDAVQIVFCENENKNKYDMLEIIKSLLHQDKLRFAIRGETMIKAFLKVIQGVPIDDNDSAIESLKKDFPEISFFEVY